MTIRTILVSVDGSKSCKATLETAFDVAQRMGVHVDALHVRPDALDQVPAIGDGMTGDMADRVALKATKQADERAAEARALFDEVANRHAVSVIDPDAAPEGLSASWIERVGRRHKVMVRLGRVHDLIVVGHPSDPKNMGQSLALNALFETGRPVLMAPPNFTGAFGRRIAVAWNASAQCARALGGATNFFEQAEEVVILTAHSDATPVSVVPELETYLKRHNVRVEVQVFGDLGKEHLGGSMLLEECKKAGADMLVMGARNDGPLKKLLLGSATKDIMTHAPIPVLMGS